MKKFYEHSVEFTEKYNNNLKKVCEPLFNFFGMNYFFYAYISYNLKCCVIGTHIDLVQHYLCERLFRYNPFLILPQNLKTGVYLYSSVADNKFQTSITNVEQKFRVRHNCIITQQDKEGCHTYGFASPIDHFGKENLIVNQNALFKQFIKYFHMEMAPIIDSLHANGVSISDKENCYDIRIPSIELSDLEKQKFLKIIGLIKNEKILEGITRREKEYLQNLVRGKSNKQIATDFNISLRTVEHYIEKLREKFHCYSRGELIERLIALKEMGLGSDIFL